MALHDYYQDRYAIALSKSKNSKASPSGTAEIRVMNTLMVPVTIDAAFSGPTSRPTSPELDEEVIPVCSDQSILYDKDYLQYLTTPYLASVAEAIDDDGSGFIRISEANEFTSTKPEDWTLLQWIAYWARGWASETAYYSQLIGSIYSGMRYRLGNTLSQNSGLVFTYLIGDWANTVKLLTWCGNAKADARTDTALDDLVRAHMKLSEDKIEASLHDFLFTLDSPEALGLVCETNRIEKVRVYAYLRLALLISRLNRTVRMCSPFSLSYYDNMFV